MCRQAIRKRCYEEEIETSADLSNLDACDISSVYHVHGSQVADSLDELPNKPAIFVWSDTGHGNSLYLGLIS